MRRILVMGPPGSGKSTLARRLGAEHGLPVFHLDQAFWQPGWIETPAEEFRTEVERIATLPAWVIDGNYTASTLDPRFRAADTVIYLDVPSWLCVLRILWRTTTQYRASAGGFRSGLCREIGLGVPAFHLDLEPRPAPAQPGPGPLLPRPGDRAAAAGDEAEAGAAREADGIRRRRRDA